MNHDSSDLEQWPVRFNTLRMKKVIPSQILDKKERKKGCFQFMIWSTNTPSSIKINKIFTNKRKNPEHWLIPWCICICSDPVYVKWQRSRCLSLTRSSTTTTKTYYILICIEMHPVQKKNLDPKKSQHLPIIICSCHWEFPHELNRKTTKTGFVMK